ncbi:hypothetical protein KVR01_001598 [Diaporthe batatas]|uniref:uncharacterized protein n=1 Tax=Diaporthe batatas TaxID=748121 RepID=UPI001D057CA5|nr:uncharacterized protein KVR01_001598 [Diaporthe batatas]KAG8168849.1 hypothetical protein KVR01_001598 [Diaporthe batatas]
MSLLHNPQQTPPQSPRPSSQSTIPAEESNRAVDALVDAIRNLASDDNYKMISDVFRDAQKLKTENARLASASRDVLEEYRKFRNELEAKETKLLEQQSQLQQDIIEKDARIQELKTSNSKLDAKFQKSRRKLDEESQKCLELAEKRSELEKTASVLKASLDEKNELASAFEGNMSKMDDGLAEAKRDLELRSAELASLEAAKKEVEEQLGEARASSDANNKQLAEVEQAKATVDAELAEVNLRLGEKAEEMEKLTTTKDELASELAKARDELLDKSKEFEDLATLKSSLDVKVSELAAKIEDQALELDGLSQAKARLDSATTETHAALEVKTLETEELALQLAELRVNYDNKATQVQSLTAQLADISGKLDARSQELQELFETKAEVDSKLAEARTEADAERESKMTAQQESAASTESLQKEAERTAILLDEVNHLRQTISTRNEEVEKLKGEIVKGNDDLSQTQSSLSKLENIIQELERDLQSKTDRLDQIDAYQVQLKHEPEETCVEILDTIWVSILNLCEHHFGQDLDPTVLRDPSCWASLRSADHLRAQAVRLPLPRSNTPAAKQMRIAAVLAALTRSMARHIFRPAWWTAAAADAGVDAADGALGSLLRRLEAASPEHERHLRGALLAAAGVVQKHSQSHSHSVQNGEEGKKAGEEQGASNPHAAAVAGPARRRAAAVVREVTFLVQHLLSALQYEAFRRGLEECVALACGQWARVQAAAMKVEPYFGPPYDDFDWQVLMLPEGFEGSLGDIPGAAAAGQDAVASSTPSPSPLGDTDTAARDANEDTSTIAESVRSVIDPADIMMVLWPTMCAVEGGELVSITQGLVMAKEQAAAAFEEEGRRRAPKHNGKRARSMSQSRNGAAGKPHSGKAVLAQLKRERDDGSAAADSRSGSRNGSLNAVD